MLYASSIFIVNAVPIRIISFFTASIIQLSPRYHNIVRFLGLVITIPLSYLLQRLHILPHVFPDDVKLEINNCSFLEGMEIRMLMRVGYDRHLKTSSL